MPGEKFGNSSERYSPDRFNLLLENAEFAQDVREVCSRQKSGRAFIVV